MVDQHIIDSYGLQEIDLSQAHILSKQPGEFLIREGEHLSCLYFVLSGKSKVLLSLSDGKRILVAYFQSSGTIGDVELMEGELTALASVQAVTTLTCLVLPLSYYHTILMNNLTFVQHVARELAVRLVKSNINGAITTLQPVETKLCAYITQSAIDGVFQENLTEVAEMIGSSYRHTLRTLEKLCSLYILQKTEFGYVVLHEDELLKRGGDHYLLKK